MPSHTTSPNYSMPGVSFEVIEQGTIRIGGTKVYELGADLKMTESFDVTTLEQKDGHWQEHPIVAHLPKNQEGKRRVIPIMIPFDDPDLVLQSSYMAFDGVSRRVACKSISQGKARRREADDTLKTVDCAGPERCAFVKQTGLKCQWFGRMRVLIDVEGYRDDPLQTFVLRSAGYNTLRGVEASLRQYHAALGNRLRGVHFNLNLNTATTATSDWNSFDYISLSLNGGNLIKAAQQMHSLRQQEQEFGLDFSKLESAVRLGLAFRDLSKDDNSALIAEFFPVTPSLDSSNANPTGALLSPSKSSPGTWQFDDIVICQSA